MSCFRLVRGIGPVVVAVLACLPLGLLADTVPVSTAHVSTPEELHARLQSLDALLAACQQQMTADDCKSEEVGSDMQVQLPDGVRQIRFQWLRTLLDHAANSSEEQARVKKAKEENPVAAEEKPSVPALPALSLEQRMKDARARLVEDGRALDESTRKPAGVDQQRKQLASILAAKEYGGAVAKRTLRDRALEKLGNWIDKVLGQVSDAGAKSKWIGPTVEIVFGVVLCVALVWFFVRLERQGRFSAAMIRPGPVAGAASARDWQLWLHDAREAAAQGAWREAIHLTYWASISRLESSGLWPADRARTPREYLALLAPESSQHPDLLALTQSFERTWYAGQAAAEPEFRRAEELAASLGAKAGTGARAGVR